MMTVLNTQKQHCHQKFAQMDKLGKMGKIFFLKYHRLAQEVK